MKKLLLRTMILLCALVVGSNAWAVDVTFTFNTDAGLTALGITKPAASAGTSLSTTDPYTISGVSFSVTNGSGTATRVWNASGNTDLRIYNGSSLTFTAPSNITSIVLSGTTVNGFTCGEVGSFSAGTWTGNAASVTLTATATEKINTITVTYTSATTVSTPTFSPAGGTFATTQNVTINCSTDGASIYYTTDGTDPSTSSSLYSSAISVSSTTTIKAIATKSGMTNSDIASATYTFVTPLPLPFSETFNTNTGEGYTGGNDGSWSGSVANNTTIKSDNDGWLYISGYGAKECIKLGTGSIQGSATIPFVAFESGKTYQLTFKAGAWNGGTEVTGLNLSITNGTLSASSVTLAKGAFTDYSIIITGTTEPARIKFEASQAANNRFFLDEVQVKEVTVEAITPATEYSTLTSAKNLDFTGHTTLKAYIAKSVSAGKVNLVPVNKVPAGTGILLKATTTGSPINVPVFTGDGDDMTGNLLAGSATAETNVASDAGYILKSGVFQPSSGGDLPAGKAYLAIAVSSARSLDLNFEDEETTGVNEVKTQKVDGQFYDLQGRKVATPSKGLYIVKNKKVIIK